MFSERSFFSKSNLHPTDLRDPFCFDDISSRLDGFGRSIVGAGESFSKWF